MTGDARGAYSKIRSRPGDVFKYRSARPEGWCREGLAVADDRGVLVDTYWQVSGDNHVLTDEEIRTGQVLFNLGDYDEVPRSDLWVRYAEVDRGVVTSQHGLQRRYYVRKGAAPDHATMVANAEEQVAKAAADVERARRELAWRERELAELLTSASGDKGPSDG